MSSSENRKENKEDNKIGLIVKIDPREQNLDWISKICENGHLQVIAVIRNSTDINDLNLPENGRNYVLELGFGEKLRKFDFSEPLTDDVYNIPIFWGDDQGDILEKWKTVEPRLYAYPRDISPDLSVEIKKEIYGGVELANLSRFELEPVKTIFTTFTLKDEDYGFLSSTHWYGLCKIGKKCLSAGLKKRALECFAESYGKCGRLEPLILYLNNCSDSDGITDSQKEKLFRDIAGELLEKEREYPILYKVYEKANF